MNGFRQLFFTVSTSLYKFRVEMPLARRPARRLGRKHRHAWPLQWFRVPRGSVIGKVSHLGVSWSLCHVSVSVVLPLRCPSCRRCCGSASRCRLAPECFVRASQLGQATGSPRLGPPSLPPHPLWYPSNSPLSLESYFKCSSYQCLCRKFGCCHFALSIPSPGPSAIQAKSMVK